LAGEYERSRGKTILNRIVDLSCVYRSAFELIEWDSQSGDKIPATKFIDGSETPVDVSGESVEDPAMAAEIPEGNFVYRVMSPLNVRYRGARYAHNATEVLVGELLPLRDVFATWPKLRNKQLSSLLADVPAEAEEYLQDLRGENELAGDKYDEDDLELRGDDLNEEERQDLLDAMRWGVIPIAQYKCLDSATDSLGRALVDILKDPQDLLDFVNASILKLLRMAAQRRYFLNQASVVKTSELLDDTQSVVWYNGQLAPVKEDPGEIPRTVIEFADRFQSDFEEFHGISATSMGKHVSGVTSGRHAEALRSGDETLLGLTRNQVEEGLVAMGKILLAGVKKEWTTPRKVRYLGEDRKYMEKHFSGADLLDTEDVVLKKGTLLLQSPAQITETLYGLSQMEVLTPAELRRLAPLTDVAGVSLTEDSHYIRARRQGERFLAGPPPELMAAYADLQAESKGLEQRMERIQGEVPYMVAIEKQAAQDRAAEFGGQLEAMNIAWQMKLQEFLPRPEVMEQDPIIATIHYEEHARDLASEKVEALEVQFPWWVEPFRQHTYMEGILAMRIPPPAPPPGTEPEGEEGGSPAPEGEQAEPVAQKNAPPTGGPEMFEPNSTGVVP
jgi:hypothetical protein